MKRIAIIVLPILLIAAACSSTGGTQTKTIDIPYPNADVITLNLATTAGQVTVNPVNAAGIQGSLTTNVGAWVAATTSNGASISLTQGTASADVIPDAQNAWDLKIGTGKPLILNHSNTSADTTLNLGGLALTQLNLSATNGNYTVRYAAPAPSADGGTATIQLTNGSLEAAGLGNSHLSRLAITTTGGNVQLSFDSTALTQDMNVRIDTRAGDVLLRIAPNLLAQVIYRTSSGTVLETDPQYTKANDITYTVGDTAAGDAPRLLIEIRTIIGDLRMAGA